MTKIRILFAFFLLVLLAALLSPTRATAGRMAESADLFIGPSEFESGTKQGLIIRPEGLTLAPNTNTGHYLSPIIEAPLPFNAVVPQWLSQIPESSSITIQLRTGTDTGWWSDWYVIEENDDWMSAGQPNIIGSMIAVPAADVTHQNFQFSVTFSRFNGRPAALLEHLTLTFIDSTNGPSAEELLARQEALDRQQVGPSEAGYPKPTVVSRSVWCTDPACIYSNDLEYVPVDHLIVHHTVTSNGSGDWAAIVRAIWQFHTFNNGWGDIGYNYLADMNGVLYEGHLGGDDVVGTHASGANYGSMGLALIGTFTDAGQNPPGITPPPAMVNSAANLLAWKADQKNIDVFDASRMPDITCEDDDGDENPCNISWGLPHLMGHRDVRGTTQCPGNQAHAILPSLRSYVAGRIGFVSPNIYFDELSGAFTKSNTGGWKSTANHAIPGCGFNGHAYYDWSTTDPGASSEWAEWRPSLSQSGFYDLEVYAPYCLTGRGETFGAKYQITHANGSETVTVNHEANIGTWMNLGSFHFNAGNSGLIRLTDLTTTDDDRGIWFDAIRLRPAELCPLPEITLGQPVNNVWKTNRTVHFNWSMTNTGCVSTTRLEVATDSAFNNTIFSKDITGVSISESTTFNQDYGQLYWRVKAITQDNQTAVSAVATFGIDTGPPDSEVNNVYKLEDGRYFVYWSGWDALSGIKNYDIYYQADDASPGDWVLWLDNTTGTSAKFSPPDGRIYWFRSSATDMAGNLEDKPLIHEAGTGQAIQLQVMGSLPQIFKN